MPDGIEDCLSGDNLMDELPLRKTISTLPLGGLQAFEQTGSTNDVARLWAANGAPDLALVYAEEQTAGRGRGNRQWYTPAGTGLAFSLVLYPTPGERQSIPLFSGLGAMAVCEALIRHGLHPQIKWPNDVLLNRRKVCGVLVEAIWTGENVESIILGIGVNVRSGAVPPADKLTYPATSIDDEMGIGSDRLVLLKDTLQALLYWRNLLTRDVFINSWEDHLAFRGEQVEIWVEDVLWKIGMIEGLERDGSLRLLSQDGAELIIQFGEVNLRPVL
jgi:BirA family biotin operon repressor/biotin-[acetyl-CoA-carboxylase] ligase